MAQDLPDVVQMLLSAELARPAIPLLPDESPATHVPRIVTRGLFRRFDQEDLGLFHDRLFLFSQDVGDRRVLSIASSRLGIRLDLETWWFDLLRTAVLHCHEDDEMLVTAEGSSTCEAVRRAAELFQKPCLYFRPLGKGMLATKEAAARWLRSASELLDQFTCDSGRNRDVFAMVSPPLSQSLFAMDHDRSSLSEHIGGHDIPLADQLQLVASDRTYVISLRKHGHLHSLLSRRLQWPETSWQSILIASNAEGQLPEAAHELPAGWIPWLVVSVEEPNDGEPLCSSAGPNHAHSAIRLKSNTQYGYTLPTIRRRGPIRRPSRDPVAHPEEWLLHWTRPATGPWPDESPDDYLDSLILRTDRADRSALATLLRIVTDGVIRGSSKGVRGGYSVVSLTAVPLVEFRRRRTFRSHLHRFDFEPWGLGFRRSALADLARQVVYGDETDWQGLANQDRPFFQKATMGGATNNIAEREWRVLNELVFRQFAADDVCVFVPTSDDAEILTQHARWGIVITPD